MFELYNDQPKLDQKEAPKSNGHSGDADKLSDYHVRDYRRPDGTLDVEAWFAVMSPTGPGVHHFQPAAMTALLCEGRHPKEVIDIVATQTVAQGPGLGPECRGRPGHHTNQEHPGQAAQGIRL